VRTSGDIACSRLILIRQDTYGQGYPGGTGEQPASKRGERQKTASICKAGPHGVLHIKRRQALYSQGGEYAYPSIQSHLTRVSSNCPANTTPCSKPPLRIHSELGVPTSDTAHEPREDSDNLTPAVVTDLVERMDGAVAMTLSHTEKSMLATIAQATVEVRDVGVRMASFR